MNKVIDIKTKKPITTKLDNRKDVLKVINQVKDRGCNNVYIISFNEISEEFFIDRTDTIKDTDVIAVLDICKNNLLNNYTFE